MSGEETAAFEKEVNSNHTLEAEYKDVSAAYRLIGDQLQQRDEEAFRKKLLEVMKAPVERQSNPVLTGRFKWYYLVPAAASVALLLILFLTNRGSDRIIARYFDPQNDPVVLAYSQDTRAVSDPWMARYKEGHYLDAMENLSLIIQDDPENHVALLFFLLSSMEAGLQDDAIERVIRSDIKPDHQLGRSLIWYNCLAMVKSGQPGEAAERLQPLAERPGYYQREAARLRKKLLK